MKKELEIVGFENFKSVNHESVDSLKLLDRKQVLSSARIYWVIRRTQDVIFSLLAILVLAPFLLLTAAVVYLDDPHGSPIFTQTRIGRDGRIFKLYKFRSMYVNAEERLDELMNKNEMDGPVFKMKDDPRITKVGRVIRRYSIDELPQLINVLRGDMSIVGPRPALPREVSQYNAYQRQRLLVTPGLTCYWQILPHRNDTTFDEWMDLDIKYIQERSFWIDWRIIFQTVLAVVKGNGE